MGSPVHVSDKGHEPWNTQEDDVFHRYMDSDPFELSSSENTADRSSSEDFANLFDFPDTCSKSGQGSPKPQYSGDSLIKSGALEISDADLFRHFSSEAAKINERVSLLKHKSAQPAVCMPESNQAKPSNTGVPKSQANGSGPSPPMAQPKFSRRATQERLAERLEESAQRLDASAHNQEAVSPMPSASGTQNVGQGPHSMPNFSTPTRSRRPLSYQGVSSATNSTWNHSNQFSPVSNLQSQDNGNPEWTFPQPHEPPATPLFGGEMSPGSMSTVTSPQVGHGARWDQGQMPTFDSFMMDPPNTATTSRQSRIQPLWPTTSPEENNYAFYQNAQYQPVRSFSQDTIYGDEKASMAMNSLFIDCNANGGGYKHESGAVLARRNAFAPTSSNQSATLPYQHPSFPNISTNAPHFSPYPQPRSPSPQRIATPSTPRSRRASRNQNHPSHGHRRSKSGQSPHSISRPSSAGVTPRRSKSISAGAGAVGLHEPSLPGASSRSRSASGKGGISNGHSHGHQGQHGGGASFVNFTPQDSKKILTGVAPSGSSKTKARREKEAADKRKKWSEAATKAILAAGGTLESLPKDLEKEEIFNTLSQE